MTRKKIPPSSDGYPLPLLMGGIILLVIGVVTGIYWLLDPTESLLPGITGEPVVYSARQNTTLLAETAVAETGIPFVNTFSAKNQIEDTYIGAGVAVGDYDNDGLVDIFLVSGETTSRLYRNLGGFRFEDATEKAGLTDTADPGGLGIGAYFADVDNDGDLDLFRTNWKVRNRLFRNNGDGTFADMTEEAGVGYVGAATTATFADYDRDGDLDFFVVTYGLSTPRSELENTPPTDRQMAEQGERDLLYRNHGNGTFTEIAEQAGIQGGYWGLSAVFADIDHDNWPDLYVTNDFWSPDTFYHNKGDGTFQLIEPAMVQNTPWSSRGVDFADINNDGLNDYFVGGIMSRDHTTRLVQQSGMDTSLPPSDTTPQLKRNSLYLNNGDGSFSDIAWMAGVAASEWTWSAKFADLDLDGFVDLLVTDGMGDLGGTNLVFRNNGNLTFDDVSTEWGFDTAVIGHGMALADLDNDGDLDMVVNHLNEPAGIYRNTTTQQRLEVRLHGQTSNRFGLGARITLTTDRGIQTSWMSSSGGYLSGHQPVIIFGLGGGAQIQELKVEWPSGNVQVFPDATSGPLLPDRRYTIVELTDSSPVPPANWLQAHSPWFVEVAAAVGINWRHVESVFDDFSVQKLLPRGLSQLGPGLAWADVNGDGYDDLYVTGAAGQTGVLYQNEGDGTFSDVTAQTSWNGSAEELAVLWAQFGAAPELFLSYSTMETPGGVSGGRFLADPAQPFTLQDSGWQGDSLASGSSLASADFDRDGDLDLFVGGRVVPGRWPLPAASHLYANQNGQLSDVAAMLAPELQNLGLVTGSLWADVDNDGDSDLLVATEWGPVRLLVNENGRFSDQTNAAGLNQWRGLWTGITAGDYDHDGDIDLAVANLGLNTQYMASPDHPLTLFAGDVNGTGSVNIIETEWVGDVLYPTKEWGMAGADMPFILEQFPTALLYAQASVEQVYGDRLAQLQRFEVNTLAHMVFLNEGNGRFIAHPLPQLAQITAGYGITTADFDNDGHDDLYLVGNFSYADHETGVYSGGVSYWLRGNGDGTFTAVPPAQSGLLVPYDGRGVAVADYDRDGWTDIAVGANNHAPLLFRNQAKNANCSLQLRLVGLPGNPAGIGSRITVTLPDGSNSVREVMAGSGYLSQDSATLLFGVGAASQVTVSVRWSDGAVSQPTMVQVCQLVQINR